MIFVCSKRRTNAVLSPLAGESEREGALHKEFTLSLALSRQGRG